ncbi:MAG TPA: DUF3795 domain-containing protein [Thermodesulfobacteriota bacterium]|nr:DUF3795 domain-containing protein [Thermodesulfobacteriota bacterium]
MEGKKQLAAPCGLYCGVCAIYIAHKEDNQKFKERLPAVYGAGLEEIRCEGCLSEDVFVYCRTCAIRSCTAQKGLEGCHRCEDFPCRHIDEFPIPVGKKVIHRSIPAWRVLGTERWMLEEEKRYHCPSCGYRLFRGAKRCRSCRAPVDVD